MVVSRGSPIGREPSGAMACSPKFSTSFALSYAVTGGPVSAGAVEKERSATTKAIGSRIDAHPCLRLAADGEAADRHAEVRFRVHANPRLWLAILSGLTLTLLPAMGTADVTVTAEVWQGDALLAAQSWRDRVDVYFQLFLIFAPAERRPKPYDERFRRALAGEVVVLLESTLAGPPAPLEAAQ